MFDALDGRVARLTNSTSRFGIEYDSLSDLVAFGVAPGILVYRWALEPWMTWGWLAASLYVTCGALRLARFNVQFDNAEKRHFIGLPIPAAAEVIACTVLLYYKFGGEGKTHTHAILLLVTYALAGLMVSNLKYFSFKETELYRRQPFWILMAVIVLLKLIIAEPQIMLFMGFFAVCVLGTVALAVRARQAAARADAPAHTRGRRGGAARRCAAAHPARAHFLSTTVARRRTAALDKVGVVVYTVHIMFASRNARGLSLLLELLLLSLPGASGGA